MTISLCCGNPVPANLQEWKQHLWQTPPAAPLPLSATVGALISTSPNKEGLSWLWLSMMIVTGEILSSGTLPELRETIIAALRHWRDPSYPTPEPSTSISHAFRLQNSIGWWPFLQGHMALEWASVQNDFLVQIGRSNAGHRWISQLIKKVFLISWDMWDCRNHRYRLEEPLTKILAQDIPTLQLWIVSFERAQERFQSDTRRTLRELKAQRDLMQPWLL